MFNAQLLETCRREEAGEPCLQRENPLVKVHAELQPELSGRGDRRDLNDSVVYITQNAGMEELIVDSLLNGAKCVCPHCEAKMCVTMGKDADNAIAPIEADDEVDDDEFDLDSFMDEDDFSGDDFFDDMNDILDL